MARKERKMTKHLRYGLLAAASIALLGAGVAVARTSGPLAASPDGKPMTVVSPQSKPLAASQLRGGFDAAHSDLTPSQLHGFADFPVYGLGSSFGGFALTHLGRKLERAQVPGLATPKTLNYVDQVYGDCVPVADTGCAPPLTVQVWPACERTLADYDNGPLGPTVSYRRLTIRGVPAADFGDWIEVYTGDVTVVISGSSGRALDAARSLVPANTHAKVLADGNLPRPAAGAVEGALAC
jgi:hypothetical protein